MKYSWKKNNTDDFLFFFFFKSDILEKLRLPSYFQGIKYLMTNQHNFKVLNSKEA